MYYKINTFGCQMNVHESEKLAGVMEELGYMPTTEDDNADVVIFNTCCIRETAEQKILGHIGNYKKLKAKNPKKIVAVVGCMTQQDNAAESLIKMFPFVNIVLGTHNLDKLKDYIISAQQKKLHIVNVVQTDGTVYDMPISRSSGVNAWINIIYGCNNFCSYCIVPYVRGRERSRQSASIIDEAKNLVKNGYKEITLLGQNVNSYGKDLADGSNFADLLNDISSIDGKFRLRFLSSHPKDLTDDVIKAMATSEKVCNSIHLPLQAGSDNVLKAMNRKYNRSEYMVLIDKLKSAMPDILITSDIMVGFAGETDKDFEDTLDLVRYAEFSSIFPFVYSVRKGTAAEKLDGHLPYKIKQQRIKRLIEVQTEITNKISRAHINNNYEVLVDDKADTHYLGRTSGNRLVKISSDTDILGQFVNVKITKAQSASLFGKVTE